MRRWLMQGISPVRWCSMAEKFLAADSQSQLSELFGSMDGNISAIEKQYGVSVVLRDGGIKIIGEERMP